MTLKKKWSPFNKRTTTKIKNVCGVYEIADCDGNIIYIGEGMLRDRAASHFLRGRDPIPQACKIRFDSTGSKRRAEERERALLDEFSKKNKGTLPRHNKRRG